MTAIAEQLRGTAIERETKLYFLENGYAQTHPAATSRGRALATRVQNDPAMIREIWAKTGDEEFFTELERRCVKYAQDREAERRGDASEGKSGAKPHLSTAASVAVPRSSQTIPAGAAQGEAVRDREGVGHPPHADGLGRHAHPPRDANDDAGGPSTRAGEATENVSPVSSPELNGGGQVTAAPEGQLPFAPSREAEAPPLGHNNPPRKPAFDPEARRKASIAMRALAADTIITRWKLSDGELVCNIPLYELRRRDEDGEACRIIRDAVEAKFAPSTVDDRKPAKHFLNEAELEICFQQARQAKAARLAEVA